MGTEVSVVSSIETGPGRDYQCSSGLDLPVSDIGRLVRFHEVNLLLGETADVKTLNCQADSVPHGTDISHAPQGALKP